MYTVLVLAVSQRTDDWFSVALDRKRMNTTTPPTASLASHGNLRFGLAGLFLIAAVLLGASVGTPSAFGQTTDPVRVISTIAGLAPFDSTMRDGPIAEATFPFIHSVAMDRDGTMYVSCGEAIRKLSTNGIVTTLALDFGQEPSFGPTLALAVGPTGDLFVADCNNKTIRRVSAQGVVTTLAGKVGNDGYVDGVGADARFGNIVDLVVDSHGFIFITDSSWSCIRTLAPDGTVTTYAGKPGNPASTDGVGQAAGFSMPGAIAIDRADNLYVGDSGGGNSLIRKITPAGIVSTLAGNLNPGNPYSWADGKGSAAQFSDIGGLVVDNAGNVFVADYGNDVVRKVAPDGTTTTLAGSPYAGGEGTADGTGLAARFDTPADVTLDSSGNIYVADCNNGTIRKVSPTGAVTTFAGIRPSHGLVDGTGSNARFHMPSAITLDSSGNLVVSDSYQSVIRKVTPSGSVTTVPLVNNDLAWPLGLAFDKQGNLYVADSYNYAVRMIAPDGVMTKVADLQSMPIGLAIDSAGNIFVSQTASIVKIAPGGAKSVFVGGTLGSANGVGGAAQFNCVYGLAVDRQDNLYAADYYGQAIRKVTPAGVVTTVAGQLGKVGEVDGPAGTALLECPTSVTVDASGILYFTERFSGAIRQATPDGTVTTLARDAYRCGGVSMLQGPAGIVVDAHRNLYISNSGENIVTRATLALKLFVQPSSATVAEGQTAKLSVAAIGDGMPGAAFQWQASANSGGPWHDLASVGPYSGVATDTLTITGATTALNGHQYRCLANNAAYSNVESGMATLTVYPLLLLSVQPQMVSVAEGQSAQFSVTVMGDGMPTTSFRWQVSADRGGTWSNLWDDWYYRGYNTETLTIRAATAALNGYQYRCLGSNAAQSNVPSDVATLTMESPLASWRQLHFGTTAEGGVAANGADPDFDGRSNLLEYALGSGPTVADTGNVAAAGFVTDGAGTHLTLTFNRISDPALSYTVEASNELGTWTSIWTSVGAQNSDGPVTVTDSATVQANARRFLRLRVSY